MEDLFDTFTRNETLPGRARKRAPRRSSGRPSSRHETRLAAKLNAAAVPVSEKNEE